MKNELKLIRPRWTSFEWSPSALQLTKVAVVTRQDFDPCTVYTQLENSEYRIRAGTGPEVVGKPLETVVSGPEMTRESPEATGSLQPDSGRKQNGFLLLIPTDLTHRNPVGSRTDYSATVRTFTLIGTFEFQS